MKKIDSEDRNINKILEVGALAGVAAAIGGGMALSIPAMILGCIGRFIADDLTEAVLSTMIGALGMAVVVLVCGLFKYSAALVIAIILGFSLFGIMAEWFGQRRLNTIAIFLGGLSSLIADIPLAELLLGIGIVSIYMHTKEGNNNLTK